MLNLFFILKPTQPAIARQFSLEEVVRFAEQYLVQILSQERTTSSELIKKLLRDYLQTHQSKQSVLERMGGVPKHLLSVGNLSDRDIRREIIASRIRASHQQKL